MDSAAKDSALRYPKLLLDVRAELADPRHDVPVELRHRGDQQRRLDGDEPRVLPAGVPQDRGGPGGGPGLGNRAGDAAANIAGWEKPEFFVFIATTMIINSVMQAFFMPNAQELSELVRTGGLDFRAVEADRYAVPRLAAEEQLEFAGQLRRRAAADRLRRASRSRGAGPRRRRLLYPLYLVCGVAIMYSIMITLAATSIWLGRNQTLYDFWFYITNFSRYPMEIYRGSLLGDGLRLTFTYLLPILVVINVPARVLAKPLTSRVRRPRRRSPCWRPSSRWLASRWVFTRALESYRSASS